MGLRLADESASPAHVIRTLLSDQQIERERNLATEGGSPTVLKQKAEDSISSGSLSAKILRGQKECIPFMETAV